MIKTSEYNGKTMIWLDIERFKWNYDLTINRQFIIDMMSAPLPDGWEFGIYSGHYSWEAIVGLDWDYPAQKGLPLWYAHYDDDASFSDFKSFGGWSAPFMK